MEGACGDEEHMIGSHKPVTRIHGGAFHNRQDVPLHAFAAHIRALPTLASRDLVHLIQEDNAVPFHALNGCACHLFHVD